ncbi:MAG: TIGR03936 family radical SAM-associated protein [Planctomycetota bacterium]
MNSAENEIRQKVSLEFKKECFARFYSHHDLMRFFERLLRRAEMPVRYSSGFNPQPRLIFLSALALGIESDCEVVEIEFTEFVSTDVLKNRISPLMPAGLEVKDITELPKRKKGQVLSASIYRISGFPESEIEQDKIRREVDLLNNTDSWTVTRKKKTGDRELDVAGSITGIKSNSGFIEVEISGISGSAARPDEISERVCSAAGCDQGQTSIRKTAIKFV